MEDKNKGLLANNHLIDDKYSVILFIKEGNYSETYRVKGTDGKLYLLKLIKLYKLTRSAFDSDNNPLEIEFLKEINHPNIVSYKDSGELIYKNKKFSYLVLDFIVGETLSERISRENISTLYDVKQIAIEILTGLSYLHSLEEPIIHNQITPQNIMLDLSTDIPVAKIIDFSYARSFHQSSKSFNKEGMNLNYVASECFNNQFSQQSDLFSVGAIMYHLLFGMPPWFKDVSKYISERMKAEEILLDTRKKALVFKDVSEEIVDFNDSILFIIKKALNSNPDNRFKSADEFIQALNGQIEIQEINDSKEKKKATQEKIKTEKKGNGFGDIAGMKELKDQLTNDVIELINDPEGARLYKTSMPNGMLLYGPPGCGKTFFANKFAEEVGFNYMFKTASDLKSMWVNESQKKIAEMFEEAEKNAPTIIFIDEFNELVPSRTANNVHEMSKSAVNEMLAQMDRTGEKGIFIIGATNYPGLIDDAILRAGRIDKIIYVSPPDFEARKSMFEMFLDGIPKDFGIDYEKLALLTENYVSSEIKLIVEDVLRSLQKARARVTMEILVDKITNTKPTAFQKYEKSRKKFESSTEVNNDRPRVGF